MLKELKQKKCSNCKYNFKTETLNCCERPDRNLFWTLKPLKLICFRKTKGAAYGKRINRESKK